MKFRLNNQFVAGDFSVVGEVELLDRIFAHEVNKSAIYELIKNQLTNKRQGNASSKNIAMMIKTTKKPWRQKGTGNARAGTKKSPLWVGGAVTFGPHKRDFTYRIPKKIKQKAFFSLLSSRVKDGSFYVLEDIDLEIYKTKKIVELFKPLKSNRVFYVVHSNQKNYEFIKKSSDNIIWLKVVNVEAIEAKDVFYADKVVFSTSALDSINKTYSK